MKHLRQYIRRIILEDKAAFVKDLTTNSNWNEQKDAPRGGEERFIAARKRGRIAKTLWAKHVDREFVNSLIYVHYTNWEWNAIDKFFLKRQNRNEISCEAFLGDRYVKFEGAHGSVGLIMKGFVTILGNDQDRVFSLSTKHYDQVFPDMKKTSGINKGIGVSQPETFVLDRKDFEPTNDYRTNEALLDNWNVQAIISYEHREREYIKYQLEENGINIPVLDPSVDDLSSFTNGTTYHRTNPKPRLPKP